MLCQCGCGSLTKPGNKYIQNHHKFRTGESSNKWSGGRGLSSNGYVFIYVGTGNHPRTRKKWPYVFEHVLVMEKHLGRYIDGRIEDIHHINGNPEDNRLENLMLLSKSDHSRLFSPRRINMSNRQCSKCKAKESRHWRFQDGLQICHKCYMRNYNATYSTLGKA